MGENEDFPCQNNRNDRQTDRQTDRQMRAIPFTKYNLLVSENWKKEKKNIGKTLGKYQKEEEEEEEEEEKKKKKKICRWKQIHLCDEEAL